jgi:phage terminase small subunit
MPTAQCQQRVTDGSEPLRCDRRERFCREYIRDLNATQAAIRSGYSRRTADRQGPALLSFLGVRARVAFLQRVTINGLELSAETVIRELAKLGLANMDDYMAVQADGSAVVDLVETTRDQRAAISELTVDEYTEGRGDGAREVKRVKIKLADKRAALVDLGRHMGIFAEDNNQARPIIIEVHRSGPEPATDAVLAAPTQRLLGPASPTMADLGPVGSAGRVTVDSTPVFTQRQRGRAKNGAVHRGRDTP